MRSIPRTGEGPVRGINVKEAVAGQRNGPVVFVQTGICFKTEMENQKITVRS